eukprot:gene15701-biopygen4368
MKRLIAFDFVPQDMWIHQPRALSIQNGKMLRTLEAEKLTQEMVVAYFLKVNLDLTGKSDERAEQFPVLGIVCGGAQFKHELV